MRPAALLEGSDDDASRRRPRSRDDCAPRGHPARVGIDGTPLATGHAIRGIGRYIRGLLDAAWTADHDWAETDIGLLLLAGQDAGVAATAWRTIRSPIRPQDLDPVVAGVLDRWAVRGSAPSLWHHTDPANPSTPLHLDQTLITVYDLIPLREPAILARMRPHGRRAYRGYLDLIRRARGVIAISQTTAADVAALLRVPDQRIRVVPPFVSPPKAPPTRPGRGAQDRPATFLFVGVPDPHKRPELAIEGLFELVRRGLDVTLDFAGVQPPRQRALLDAHAEARGLADRVRFHGRIGDEDLHRLYAETVLLALSTIEGFGLPPVEAVLAGGRVVATPTPAYLENLSNVAVFARDDSVSAVADAMEAALRYELTDAARSSLASAHDAWTVSRALRTAYRELGGLV